MRAQSPARAALWLATVVSFSVAQAASAADPATEKARLVAQKQALLGRLLYDSPVARNIETGGDAEARGYLAQARAQHGRALALIESGDAAGAEAALDDAMWLVGKARQRSPDTSARLIEQRVRYAQLSASVDSLRASYEKHTARARDGRTGADDPVLARASLAVENARGLANSDQLREANRALADAETVLMLGLSEVLGSATLEYSLRFESPAEEYGYELERNRSFAALVPLALGEFSPPPEARKLVAQHSETARTLREEAERHAARRDFDRALGALRAGNQVLQRALAATGLRVPAEGESR